MPVVSIGLRRFAKMVGADKARIIDRIPYIGLDIESLEGDTLRVEYSPNRPDFGTDWGIARALRGLLGKEVGLPEYPLSPSGIEVSVDPRLARVRPFIACAVATGLRLDDEDVRQVISLQEDLHNGLGRKRRRVAVGLHDLGAISPPVSYRAVGADFSFTPLDSAKASTVKEILSKTSEGRQYGAVLTGPLYPVIADSRGTVLSFPPVINGNATKVTTKTRNMFVDVTSTDEGAGDDVLAVIATTLAELGGKLGSVRIGRPGRPRITPDLSPRELPLQVETVRGLLGLELSKAEMASALARSRLSVRGRTVRAARYRIDLLHPVDIAEEVALGYGMDRIEGLYPASKSPGSFHPFQEFLDSSATAMAGSGMLELMTYELVDASTLYSKFGRQSDDKISVMNPKSLDHSILRDSLVPTLLGALSSNVKSEYPQRVFEVGRVYSRLPGIAEAWHLGCLTAHSSSSYSEAKMYMEAFCRTVAGLDIEAKAAQHWAFSPGRSAAAYCRGTPVGHVGEVKPSAVDSFGLNVPVSGFELDLSAVHKLLK